MSSSFLYTADINIFDANLVHLSCPSLRLLRRTLDCCHTSLGLLLCLPVHLARFQKSLFQSLCDLIRHFINMFEVIFYSCMLFLMPTDCMTAVRSWVYRVFFSRFLFFSAILQAVPKIHSKLLFPQA